MPQKTKRERTNPRGHASKPVAREYGIWIGMRSRCTNPRCTAYQNYGARGITLDPRWNSYAAFLADMGPVPSRQHSLDRIDNDGPYAPANCRWASPKAQQRNRRDHKRYVHEGRSLLLCEWAEVTGIPLQTLHERIHRAGWALARALNERPKGVGRPAWCRRGHSLRRYGRWEGQSRRCTICKRRYDRARRKGLLPPTDGAADTVEE
jgi:hypothetical protein